VAAAIHPETFHAANKFYRTPETKGLLQSVRNFENPTNNPPNGPGVGVIPTNKQLTCVDATAAT